MTKFASLAQLTLYFVSRSWFWFVTQLTHTFVSYQQDILIDFWVSESVTFEFDLITFRILIHTTLSYMTSEFLYLSSYNRNLLVFTTTIEPVSIQCSDLFRDWMGPDCPFDTLMFKNNYKKTSRKKHCCLNESLSA